MTALATGPSLGAEIKGLPVSRRTMKWRRFRRVRTVDLDGLAVAVDPARMSRDLVHMLWRGAYEDAERVIVRRVLVPGDRVVEGGGGLGVVSMTAARIVGAQNVTVFEASPVAFALMTENLANNALALDARNAALAAEEGEIVFHVHDNVISSSLFERGDTRPTAVPAAAVASVVAEKDPTVLVLDIEGAEVAVLSAAPLSGVRAVIVEIHPHVVGDAAITALYRHMFEAGFVLAHGLSWGKTVTFLKEG